MTKNVEISTSSGSINNNIYNNLKEFGIILHMFIWLLCYRPYLQQNEIR